MENYPEIDRKQLDKLRREHGGGYQAVTNKEFIMSLLQKYNGSNIVPQSGNEYVEIDTEDFYDFCHELILVASYQLRQR